MPILRIRSDVFAYRLKGFIIANDMVMKFRLPAKDQFEAVSFFHYGRFVTPDDRGYAVFTGVLEPRRSAIIIMIVFNNLAIPFKDENPMKMVWHDHMFTEDNILSMAWDIQPILVGNLTEL